MVAVQRMLWGGSCIRPFSNQLRQRIAIWIRPTLKESVQPKQTLRRLIHYAMNGIFSFSYRPLRWVTYMGLIVSAITFALSLFYLITFFAFHKPYGTGFTTLILSILFLGGVQMIAIGILGEYIGRIYEEIKQRPLYIVQDTLGTSL